MVKEKYGEKSRLQELRVRNREALQQRGEKVKVDRLLTPTIGIELGIPDVNHADDEVIWTIRRHLARHKVVSIRAQQLSEDQFLAFSRRLGSLARLPYIRPMQDFPEIIAVLKEEDEVDMGVFGGTGIRISVFSNVPLKSPYCIQGRFRRAAGTRSGRT